MEPPSRYRAHSQNSRTHDDGLRFLSREEQECLQFFEKTIDSLEESLEENEEQPEEARPAARGRGVQEVDGHLPSTPTHSPAPAHSPSPSAMLSSLQSRFHSSKDHDIIDLVRPQPGLVQRRAVDFNPAYPDFANMVPAPGSHMEMKPRLLPPESFPSESAVPGGSADGLASLHPPPGCIPTPALIAQKIAENQPGGPSSSVHRRWSEEYEKPSSPSADPPAKLGPPPTSAKPTRYPANINMILGSREHQSHSPPSISLQDRRAQMLANLSGSHPMLQEEDQDTERTGSPRRSISFKDPTPDKSRMEALSKLGLTRNRAMSGGLSLPASPKSPAETVGRSVDGKSPGPSSTGPPVSTSHQNQAGAETVPEIPRRPSLGRDSKLLPPTVLETNYQPPAVPLTNYQPQAVPLTNYQPPAVPQTNYQPQAVPLTNYQSPAVPQTNYQPPAVPQTNYQMPSFPQTNYQPPSVSQTNYQPPSVPQTNYQPPSVSQTNYQPPSVPQTNYQPPSVPQTNYQPPSVPQTNYQPPSVSQTNYQPPSVPQTNYQPPSVPQTNYQPPSVPQTNYQPPSVPQTNYQPPSVSQTNYQPPSVPQTNYQPPSVSQTNYQPPSVPQTNYQPPSVPQTNYQPPSVSQTNYQPAPVETPALAPPPEVTSPEFNSYGGKSILVKPTTTTRVEAPPSPTSPEPKLLPPALSNPTQFNSYGGKSKTINAAPVAPRRNDLPDILSSHMDQSRSVPSPPDPSGSGGQSTGLPPSFTTKSLKAPAPSPAPRPPRNSYHGPVSTQKPPQRTSSPQFRRKPASMFPSHGITVQFSGRGATEESRKDALRKLGLLKDS